VKNAEDDQLQGWLDLQHIISVRDVVIGIAASGTPMFLAH
jgi:N-acetylmuramic acid 6-phosphate (MurNAc-6-P) etherase